MKKKCMCVRACDDDGMMLMYMRVGKPEEQVSGDCKAEGGDQWVRSDWKELLEVLAWKEGLPSRCLDH